LKVSTGTIYHHLDTLSKLIVQRDDKKYYLTELGLHAYNSLKDNIDSIITPDFSKKEFSSPILKGLMRLTPKKHINYESEKKFRLLVISITLILSGAILCGLNGLFPFLKFCFLLLS
jgi:DNA-binding PadR family transcriptional regulator